MTTIKHTATGVIYTYRAASKADRMVGKGKVTLAANVHKGGLWNANEKPRSIA